MFGLVIKYRNRTVSEPAGNADSILAMLHRAMWDEDFISAEVIELNDDMSLKE